MRIDNPDVNGNLDLDSTLTSASGVITKNGTRFIHDYRGPAANGNNLYIGVGAGNFTSTGTGTQGSYNVAIGDGSLPNLSYGSFNVGIGTSALQYLTSGSNNIGLGYGSLFFLSTGSFNTAHGAYSIGTCDSGSSNVGFGYYAGYQYKGSGATFIGYQAGKNITGVGNVAVGYNALLTETAGTYNTALGYEALTLANGVGSNTAIGSTALRATTTGYYNTAVGSAAASSMTTGYQNCALGYLALNLCTDGLSNMAFGPQALQLNIHGSNNVGVGYAAGYTSTGSSNVYIGRQAGMNAGSANGNTGIGDCAGMSTTGDYNTFVGINADSIWNAAITKSVAIGFNSKVSTSNSVVLGGSGVDAVSVGIGTAAPSETLQVVGGDILLDNNRYFASLSNTGTTIHMFGMDTSNNSWLLAGLGGDINLAPNAGNQGSQVVVKSLTGYVGIGKTPTTALDVNGIVLASGLTLCPTTSSTTGVIYKGASTFIHNFGGNDKYNTFVGLNSGSNFAGTTGTYNAAVGHDTLAHLTSGFSNMAFGGNTLHSATDGYNNAAVGTGSLYNLNSGYENIAIGTYAGLAITTGYQSVFIGHEAGRACAAGLTASVFVGYQAGYNISGVRNTAVGYQALFTETTGTDNTAVGYYALRVQGAAGSANTAVGSSSLVSLTTGSYNVGVGSLSGSAIQTGTQNMCVGYGTLYAAVVSASYNVAVGTNSLYDVGAGGNASGGIGNVGIGHTAGKGATGSKNVFIGYAAGPASGADLLYDNKLYIHNSSSNTPLIGGDFSTPQVTITGALNVNNTVATSGAISTLRLVTPAHTGQTLSTEINSLYVGGNALGSYLVREWATGALTTQRENLFKQPYYAFVGASTITTAATVAIESVATAYTNATITTSHGLLIQGGNAAGTGGACGTSYGLSVTAAVGATNNYAARFLGGSTLLAGYGSAVTAPLTNLHVAISAAGTALAAQQWQLVNSSTSQSGGWGCGMSADDNVGGVAPGLRFGVYSSLDTNFFWHANYNNPSFAGNTFQVCNTAATTYTTVNCRGINGQTGDLLACTPYGATLGTGSVFRVGAEGSLTLVATTSATTGVIYKGAARWAHNFTGLAGAGPGRVWGFNVFVGPNSGNFTMAADTDTSVWQASDNLGFGYATLYSLTTGFQNVAIGSRSLQEATTGYRNSGLGCQSLTLVADGIHNTAMGSGSLAALVSGSFNTAMGQGAGALATGSGNVFLGNLAGSQQTTGDNKLYIANSNTTTPLVYGDFSTPSISFCAGKVNIVADGATDFGTTVKFRVNPDSSQNVDGAGAATYALIGSTRNNFMFFPGTDGGANAFTAKTQFCYYNFAAGATVGLHSAFEIANINTADIWSTSYLMKNGGDTVIGHATNAGKVQINGHDASNLALLFNSATLSIMRGITDFYIDACSASGSYFKIRTGASAIEALTISAAGVTTLNNSTTPNSVLVLDIAAPAPSAFCDSHAIEWVGRAHNGAVPLTAKWRQYVDVFANSAVSNFAWEYNYNGGGWQSFMTLDYGGNLVVQGAITGTGLYSNLGNINLKKHAAFTGSSHVESTGAVQTIDATDTTVWSLTVSDTTAYWFEGTVVARTTSGTDCVVGRVLAQAHREGAGAVIGDVQLQYLDPSTSTWVITWDVSGNDVRLRVTGAAATTINWAATVKYQAVSGNT